MATGSPAACRRRRVCGLFLLLSILTTGAATPTAAQPPAQLADAELARRVNLPAGFKITIFARGLPGARFMTIGPENDLFVSLPRRGWVVRLRDGDGDGKADVVSRVLSNLDRPHGLAYHQGKLYVTGSAKVWRVERLATPAAGQELTPIIDHLPGRGGHWTRTILFGDDGKLYVSVGSSCNVCRERDRRRAALVRYQPDGSGEEIFATGLRNSVGITLHPTTREIWGTDNGRDWLGDEEPPDELNIIRQGRDYGWPFCFGDRTPDPDWGSEERCRHTEPPVFTFPAHSAPLGLTFYTGRQFPAEYRGDLFVAFHGSWNRSSRTGYKVVRVKMQEGKPVAVSDFASGWLVRSGRREQVWGRPVDLVVAPDGGLFLSDDHAGLIYKITYEGNQAGRE